MNPQINQPSPRRHHLPPMGLRRRPLSVGLVAVAAAAGAFGVVNLDSGGHGPVSVARASAISRAHTVPSVPVLQYTITDSAGDVWHNAQDGATPQDWVSGEADGGSAPTVIDGQQNGMREFYDPATKMIYRDSDTSDTFSVSTGAQLIRSTEAGAARTTVNRNATLQGQPATTYTATFTGGEVKEIWVDPTHGDRPLQSTDTTPGGATNTQVWSNYQTVTPSSTTPDPALLTALYPSAQVTTLDSSAYSAQENAAYTATAGH